MTKLWEKGEKLRLVFPNMLPKKLWFSFFVSCYVRNLLNHASSPKRETALPTENLCTNMLTYAKVKGNGIYFRRDCVFVQSQGEDRDPRLLQYFCSLLDCFPLDLCLPVPSVRSKIRNRTSRSPDRNFDQFPWMTLGTDPTGPTDPTTGLSCFYTPVRLSLSRESDRTQDSQLFL